MKTRAILVMHAVIQRLMRHREVRDARVRIAERQIELQETDDPVALLKVRPGDLPEALDGATLHALPLMIDDASA
jgi:hypothetical protein